MRCDVRRVAIEDDVTTFDNAAELPRRQIGLPSKAEAYRAVPVQGLVTESAALKSVKLLHRARLAGRPAARLRSTRWRKRCASRRRRHWCASKGGSSILTEHRVRCVTDTSGDERPVPAVSASD
jgi:hypothetical protein